MKILPKNHTHFSCACTLAMLVISVFRVSADWTYNPEDWKWKFLVYADSRSNSTAQVNTIILAEIAAATVAENPDFVLFPGDLVNDGYSWAYTRWTNAMAPVYQKGIPVYPVVGNHEIQGNPDLSNYFHFFTNNIPTNGPPGEKYRTYSIAHKNTLILAIDTYVNKIATNHYIVNTNWVDSVLATNQLPHVFAFGHSPAFKVGYKHVNNLDRVPDARNAFWRSLVDAGAKAYFCGHEHFYDHMQVRETNGIPRSGDVHQYIVGTAGAPLYTNLHDYNLGDTNGWAPLSIAEENNYGYLVVEIDHLKVTMTWKHRTAPGVYEIGSDVPYVSQFIPEKAGAALIISDWWIPPGTIEQFGTLIATNLTVSAYNLILSTNNLGGNIWHTNGCYVSTYPGDSLGVGPLSLDDSTYFYKVLSGQPPPSNGCDISTHPDDSPGVYPLESVH